MFVGDRTMADVAAVDAATTHWVVYYEVTQ